VTEWLQLAQNSGEESIAREWPEWEGDTGKTKFESPGKDEAVSAHQSGNTSGLMFPVRLWLRFHHLIKKNTNANLGVSPTVCLIKVDLPRRWFEIDCHRVVIHFDRFEKCKVNKNEKSSAHSGDEFRMTRAIFNIFNGFYSCDVGHTGYSRFFSPWLNTYVWIWVRNSTKYLSKLLLRKILYRRNTFFSTVRPWTEKNYENLFIFLQSTILIYDTCIDIVQWIRNQNS
jgi:hypothetical protein